MKMFSLKSIIDDILLIVRNNNISESEDFSRAQIANWVLAYRAFLTKQQKDKEEVEGEDEGDDSLYKTIGPLELEPVKSLDGNCLHTKKTVEELPELLSNSPENIIAVFDEEGCPIQYMNDKRRHFQYYRKYTFGEMTWFYDNGYIYLQGLVDLGRLKYIWVTGIFTDTDEESEEDIQIPGWMVPTIKQLIMSNELNVMLRMPSDEQNNSTLEEVKPDNIILPAKL